MFPIVSLIYVEPPKLLLTGRTELVKTLKIIVVQPEKIHERREHPSAFYGTQ